jgi:hypothetical protein
MAKKTKKSILAINYILACEAYPNVPNFFRTQCNNWAGALVVRFGQMLNFAIEKRLIDDKFAVGSIPIEGVPQFTEDMRNDLREVLRSGMVVNNTLSAAQTTLNILNSPADTALDKVGYKYIAPIRWYKYGEMGINATTKINQFKKSVEQQAKGGGWGPGAWLGSGKSELIVVQNYIQML